MPRLPRRDRAPVFGGADDETVEDVAAQSPAVGVGDMGDPALDAGIQLGEADFAGMIRGEPRPQPAIGAAHLARLDQAMGREDDETEPRDAIVDRQHLRSADVDDKAQPGEPRFLTPGKCIRVLNPIKSIRYRGLSQSQGER